MRGIALLSLAACAASLGCREDASAPQPLQAPPVEIRLSAPEALAWSYRREVAMDLDGDGSGERVILLSDVSISSTGAPLWEDGHRWALVIHDREHVALAYAAFVPRGAVEAAVLQPSSGGRREVLVQERMPDRVRSLTLAYEGEGRTRTVSAGHHSIEAWLPSPPPGRAGIRFDPRTLAAGDRVGSLRAESVDARPAVDGSWVGTVRFSGELTITGRTLAHPDPERSAVCFEAGAPSASRIPRWAGDERRSWFCFENVEEASAMLAPPGRERPATIVVDRFTIHRRLSDEVNQARLLRVLDRP